MKGSVRVGMESPNLTECKPKREKTLSVIFQQHIHNPVYIRRVADEMDDPIPNRNDDNLVLIEVYQPNSHKTETESGRRVKGVPAHPRSSQILFGT